MMIENHVVNLVNVVKSNLKRNLIAFISIIVFYANITMQHKIEEEDT